ncbi:unnamed protein product [Cuscuta europaea]|uniref:Uncharacterized protein n=1 Tax=Cuscuta europaea TaxID=41803 RepID=A0A9P0Z2Q5_CUSEU|nr:unnamed protein product [Cuscuta europaea]
MASACVNPIGMSPESFLDCSQTKFPSYAWLSPRVSYSREFSDDSRKTKHSSHQQGKGREKPEEEKEEEEEESSDPEDFEFRLDDPVTMQPADELFSDGKLMPLHLSMVRPVAAPVRATSPDTPKLRIRNEISGTEPYLFSPKAPRCSSRWKEILGLRKLYQQSSTAAAKQESHCRISSSSSNLLGNKSLKSFLHRSTASKSTNAAESMSLSLPLLRDTDNESLAVSSARLSLSSSSSGHEHDDLPRLSLDSEKPANNGHTRNGSQSSSSSSNNNSYNPPRVRVVKVRSENPAARVGRSPMRRVPETTAARGLSVDSPRMNSSGKIVFQSLERSSSSPSSLNGAPKHKVQRGMERSYSANVRVTPVLNVPVCSLRGSSKFGFPLFSSSSSSSQQQRKESAGVGSKAHPSMATAKHRTDRIKE